MARWIWIGQCMGMATLAAIPIGEQMNAVEGVGGVETAKLSPLQTFGVTQYRRALANGEVVRLRLATLNLQTQDESALSEQELKEKKDRQRSAIREAAADLLLLQELRPSDLEEVSGWLGAEYAFRGGDSMVPTRNGFFYRTQRLQPLEVTQLPIPPADYPVVMGRWRTVPDKIDFQVYHLHLPPHDPVKRQKQAEMVVREVRRQEGPLVVMGDLSTWPYLPQERRVLYYDGPALLNIFRTGGLTDARSRSLFGHIGALGDLILPGKEGRCPLQMALSHLLCSGEVEPVMTAIPDTKEPEGLEREILVVDVALTAAMPLPGEQT